MDNQQPKAICRFCPIKVVCSNFKRDFAFTRRRKNKPMATKTRSDLPIFLQKQAG